MNRRPQTDEDIGRSAMAKAMWRILPLILLAYVVAYVDRVNGSFASLQMTDDLKFSATIYGLGGGLFFLGYALFEVPSSLMLARFRAPRWIARIMSPSAGASFSSTIGVDGAWLSKPFEPGVADALHSRRRSAVALPSWTRCVLGGPVRTA